MKKVLTSLIMASFLALGAGAYADKNETHECPDCKCKQQYQECIDKYKDLLPGEDYMEGEFLLGFDKGVTPAEAEEFIESHDPNNELEMVERRLKWFGYTLVKAPKGKEIEYACYFDSLKDDTVVRAAEPNLILRIQKYSEEN